MRSHQLQRVAGTLAALAAATLLVAPSAAHATPVAAETQQATAGCEVTGGTMRWGVKETFRAYISGSIANGSWDASDGASYETPSFEWSGATGSIDPENGTGSVSFTGTVHFTGHDGVLDLTFANPTVEFVGDRQANLLLDSKSTDMEGNSNVDIQQGVVGDIAHESELVPENGTLTLADFPVTLTDEGAEAFAGFYEGGIDLDPLTLSLNIGECQSVEQQAPSAPQVITAESPEQEIPWLAIVVGGAALLMIGFTAGLLVGGRRPKSANTDDGAPWSQSPHPQQPAQNAPPGSPDPESASNLFGQKQ